MKLQHQHVKYIKKAFNKMKSKEDLLNLLNYAKILLHGENAPLFELKHINYHCNPNNNNSRYFTFEISKRSGEKRTIYAPSKGLVKIQQCLNLILQAIYDTHPAAKGFVNGKSIVDNATVHLKKNYVYNIDLKDFFYSIDQARIWGRLKHHPFNLNEKNGNLELANIIASLCCHGIEVDRINDNGNWERQKKNVLPQGAATSPMLSNIICERLDFYLTKVANRFGLNYSRYADDITFSSMHNVYQKDSTFINELIRIISEQNFHIKESKTRLQNTDYRQEVTGLIVNHKTNVKQKYIKELRMWLYYWENYGFEKANTYFSIHYVNSKKNSKSTVPNIAKVIGGKLDFLKMVKGECNQTYLKLNNRYRKLIGEIQSNNTTNISTPKPNILNVKRLTNDYINEQPIAQKDNKKHISDNEILKLPFVHKPQELVEYLKKFALNGTALKYATHSWDGGKDEEVFKDFEDFLFKIKNEFKSINKLNKLNKQLWAKMLSFLLNKHVSDEGWGIHRVKFGWSSPELLKAMIDDPTQKPENFIIPTNAQFHLKTHSGLQLIQKFQQVIDIFKNEIEIRDENSALVELLLECHDKYLSDFNIKSISNLENKNFYTDIDYFRKALYLVFDNIKKRSKYKDVSYILKEDSNKFILEIIHHDSFVKGRSISDRKLSLKSGDMGTISAWLLNLCDWSIESEFMEGPYRINYLVSVDGIQPYIKVDQTEGFKHIFTFYK